MEPDAIEISNINYTLFLNPMLRLLFNEQCSHLRWDRTLGDPLRLFDPFREDGQSFPYLTAHPVLSTPFYPKIRCRKYRISGGFRRLTGIFIESRRW